MNINLAAYTLSIESACCIGGGYLHSQKSTKEYAARLTEEQRTRLAHKAQKPCPAWLSFPMQAHRTRVLLEANGKEKKRSPSPMSGSAKPRTLTYLDCGVYRRFATGRSSTWCSWRGRCRGLGGAYSTPEAHLVALSRSDHEHGIPFRSPREVLTPSDGFAHRRKCDKVLELQTSS